MKQLLRLVMVLVLAACDGSPPEVETAARIDSAGVLIVNNGAVSALQSCGVAERPRLVIGDRPGDPTHELYRVFGATRLEDGRIALVDQGSQQLRYYSPEGSLLEARGREGEGPGEFLNAFGLWRQPGDTLWVGDYRPWQFEVFGPSGEWLQGTITTPRYGNPPNEIAILDDGRVVFGLDDYSTRGARFELTSLQLVLHDRSGALIDSLMTIDNGRWGQTVEDARGLLLYPWFESFAAMTARGNQLVLAHGADPELRLYSVEDDRPALKSIIRWNAGDRKITPEDVAAAEQREIDRFTMPDPQMRARFLDPLIHEDRPVAEVLPALTSVVAGRDGRLYVKTYPRPADPAPEWIAFEGDGRMVCKVRLPDGFELYEFGEGYALGKLRTEMSVETVVLLDVLAEPWDL